MGATFDNSANNGASASPFTVSITVGSGANRAAMALLHFDTGNNVSSISVSGGGATWTAVSGADTGTGSAERSVIFVAKGINSGAQTITVSWVGTAGCSGTIVTAAGVDQTTPGINGTATDVSVASPSITVTTNNGDLAVAAARNNNGALSNPTQTQIFNDTFNVDQYALASGASVTFSLSDSDASGCALAGADFKAAAGAAPRTPERTMMGVGT